MDLVTRAKNITLTPGSEWPVIEGELGDHRRPADRLCAAAGGDWRRRRFHRHESGRHDAAVRRHLPRPLSPRIVAAAFGLGMAIVDVFLLSLIIDALAPTFSGQKNQIQALKLAVYSFTPAWIAGVLRIVPLLGIFAIFAALYSIYLLYLGLPRLMKSPQDKALPTPPSSWSARS